MAVIKKYDLSGKEIGEVAIEEQMLSTGANLQMIKDYITALRANARQWSANTQTRAEVNHSGKKPHPQKGTGKARQGYLGAPHYRGGGRVHAPRPKFDQHVRINKKERQAAIRYLITEKIQDSRVHLLQYETFKAPKTKTMADFLKQLKLDGKRVLILCEAEVGAKSKKNESKPQASEKYSNFCKSLRNIPKVEFMTAPNISGYDVMVCQDIILLEPALDEFKNKLKVKE